MECTIFNQSRLVKQQTTIEWNSTLDKLPTMLTIRGVTYAPTHDKPVFGLRPGPGKYERRLETAKRMVREDVFLPLGRALLRKYVRVSQGF
jgi:hypothetical protein